MKQQLFEMFGTSNDLSPGVILTRLAAACIIACFIVLSYRLSHLGGIYSRKFNISLAALTAVSGTLQHPLFGSHFLPPIPLIALTKSGL